MSTSADSTKSVVLVVEDEALLRLDAADILEEAGFKAISAKDATEALEIMKSQPDVRVLFTDIQMPGSLDGMELARKIHEQWPKVLLLITSGNLKPLDDEIPDHGHFLRKPYQALEVIREIDALAREAAERQSPK